MGENVFYVDGWHECRGITAAERHGTASLSALSHVWDGHAYYDCVVHDPDGRALPGMLDDVRRRHNLHRVLLGPERTGGRLMHIHTRYPVRESLANLTIDRVSTLVLAPVVNRGGAEAAVFTAPCHDPRVLRDVLASSGMDFRVAGDGAAYREALGAEPVLLGYATAHFGRCFPRLHELAGGPPAVTWEGRAGRTLRELAARDLRSVSSRTARRVAALAVVRAVRRGERECSTLRRSLGMSKAAFSRLVTALEREGLVGFSPNRRFMCLTPGGARLAAHGPVSRTHVAG